MKKVFIAILLSIIIILVWYGESRKFFSLKNGKTVTVWKTYGDVCYIIPDKYYGILKPTKDFIRTSNSNNLTIFFTTDIPNTLIVQSNEKIEVTNSSGNFNYLNYSYDSTKLRNVLYKPDAKLFYKDLKANATLINIDIKENYGIGKDGKIYK